MHHQRYLNNSNKFFQDNQSTMRMEMNSRNSCTGNSRNIGIRCFIKYWLDNEELSIVYCPMHIMLADYLINPLQGELFHKFRVIIMGRVRPFTLIEDSFSYTRKERVRKHISSKYISLGTGKTLKETKNMLEDKHYKQVRTSTGGSLKKKDMPRDEKNKTGTYLR